MKKKTFIIIIFLILLYLPIINTVCTSFDNSFIYGHIPNNTNSILGFTPINITSNISFVNYQLLFRNSDILISLFNSVSIAFISATFSLIIGMCISLFLFFNRTIQKIILFLNNSIYLFPDIVLGIAFLLFFSYLSIDFGFYTILYVHIFFSIPISIILIYPRLLEVDQNQINAARDLGANKMQLINNILLAKNKNIIYIVFIFLFLYSFDDFNITYFITGNNFTTLPIVIYSLMKRGIGYDIDALFTIIIVILILCIVFYEVFLNRGKK